MRLELRNAAPDGEYSAEFLERMLNRMAVSWAKYGQVADARATVDFVDSLRMRLERYVETGNTEWLVDVANFAMMEYMHPLADNAHFRATSSAESPGRRRTDGRVDTARNIS